MFLKEKSLKPYFISHLLLSSLCPLSIITTKKGTVIAYIFCSDRPQTFAGT